MAADQGARRSGPAIRRIRHHAGAAGQRHQRQGGRRRPARASTGIADARADHAGRRRRATACRRRPCAAARRAGAAARHAGRHPAHLGHVGLRSQVRRLPHPRAHRRRPRATVQPQRARLDRPPAAPGTRAARAGAAQRLAGRRSGGDECSRRAGFPGAAERFRDRAPGAHPLRPVRPAVLQRHGPARRAAARAARAAGAHHRGGVRCARPRGHRVLQPAGCAARPVAGLGLPPVDGGHHRQARRRALPRWTQPGLDQAQVRPAPGIRHRRLQCAQGQPQQLGRTAAGRV